MNTKYFSTVAGLTFSAAISLAFIAVISPASAAVNLLNGGFDDVSVTDASAGLSYPYVTLPNYAYPGGPGGLGTVGSWTYEGGSGLVGYPPSGNPYFQGPAPLSINQYAFLQNDGTFSQTFSSSNAGLATISWFEAGRDSGGHGTQGYDVYLNSLLIGTFGTTDSQPFTTESAFGILIAGSNTLAFAGHIPLEGADQTAFLENVSVTSAVPELSTWVLMLLGFVAISFVTYRRSLKPSVLAPTTPKRCTVLPDRPNEWFVSANGQRLAGPFLTNCAAWEWLDGPRASR